MSTRKTSIIVFGAKPHKPMPPIKEHDDPKTQQLGTLATKDNGTAHSDPATHDNPTLAKQQLDQPESIDENVTHHLLHSDFQEPVAVTDNESDTNSSINPSTFTTPKNVLAIYDFESGIAQDSGVTNPMIKVEPTHQTQPKPHLGPSANPHSRSPHTSPLVPDTQNRMAQNLLGFTSFGKQKPNQVRLLCMILNHEENPFTLKTFVHLRDKPSEMMLNFNP